MPDPRATTAAWEALIRGERTGPAALAARAGLRLASVPYGVGVRVRNALFDRGWKRVSRAPVPVVSVGNLTLGGTGKTPCVEYVAGFYRDLGLRVAILSRGYGATAGPNDEAMVLEENLPDVPHLQGRDRAALAATAADELDSEILVLDDGFQHRRLARNLDIVLIDATRPPMCDRLFPAGTLREPASGLARAGAVVVTRADQVSDGELSTLRGWLARRVPGVPVADAVHAPAELIGYNGATADVLELQGKPVGAFCGIGNPEAFRRTLTGLGADVVAFRPFPDHHPYTRADVDALRAWASGLPAGALAVTTQKDWVKLRILELASRPVWAVRVGLRFRDGEEAFRNRLSSVAPSPAEDV